MNDFFLRSFDEEDYKNFVAPGVYTFKMRATTGEGTVVKLFEWDLELLDPCINPQYTVQDAMLVDQIYYATDTATPYTPSQLFTVNPSYCLTEITFTAPTVNDNQDEILLTLNEGTQTFNLARINSLMKSGGSGVLETEHDVTVTF